MTEEQQFGWVLAAWIGVLIAALAGVVCIISKVIGWLK